MMNSFFQLSAICYQPLVKALIQPGVPHFSPLLREVGSPDHVRHSISSERIEPGEDSFFPLDIAAPMATPIAIPTPSHALPLPRATASAAPIPAPSAIPNPICIDGRLIVIPRHRGVPHPSPFFGEGGEF
jgi:hypothetical protein